MDLETAKIELLLEASRNNNQLFLVEKPESRYVKGFSAPYELRDIYISALASLAREGSIKPLFKNPEMHLYLVTAIAPSVPSLDSAKARILEEIENYQFIYKIHSSDGEYVQCQSENFARFDSVRILYLRALGELLRRGKIDVKKENRDVCVYAAPKRPDPPQAEIVSRSFEYESIVEIEPLDEIDSSLDLVA